MIAPRDLGAEIVAFLEARGPASAEQVALGVRARRVAVDEALLSGPFVEASTPPGGHPHARYWRALPVASQAVPRRPGGQGRAAAMLAVLSDGRKHSRTEIFEAAGRYFLTNQTRRRSSGRRATTSGRAA